MTDQRYTIENTVFVIFNDYQGERYYKYNRTLDTWHLGYRTDYNSIEAFFKALRKRESSLNIKATYTETGF